MQKKRVKGHCTLLCTTSLFLIKKVTVFKMKINTGFVQKKNLLSTAIKDELPEKKNPEKVEHYYGTILCMNRVPTLPVKLSPPSDPLEIVPPWEKK